MRISMYSAWIDEGLERRTNRCGVTGLRTSILGKTIVQRLEPEP